MHRARDFVGVCLIGGVASWFGGCSSPAVRPDTAAAHGPADEPSRVLRSRDGANIQIEITAEELRPKEEELVHWVERAVRAIEAYYGRFPLRDAQIRVLLGRGRAVSSGEASAEGIRMFVGPGVTRAILERDWTLTHEMVHLALPSLARDHHWLEEGSATYVEPIARARAGQLTAENVWSEFVDDYARGLPQAGDQGLDRTPTWGRTYYGGALWCLSADIELRKASGNRIGLEHALRAVVAAGGDITKTWDVERLLTVADGPARSRTLRDLYAQHATTPVVVDLDSLWRDLGIVRRGSTVAFDETAPLAAIRRAITAPD